MSFVQSKTATGIVLRDRRSELISFVASKARRWKI